MSISEPTQVSIPDWADSILSGHLLENERPIASYDEEDLAIIVTDRRLFSITQEYNDVHVDSTHLRGDHIIGSNVSTSEDEDAAGGGLILLLIGGGLAYVGDGLVFLLGLVLVGLGIFALIAPPEKNTTIEIQTTDEPIQFEIPEDAKHLGQTISKVVGGDM
ncbi:hypothetical protein [Natronosalvus vescus]|uniref:hypothetical protein n=1 Tax=Natronosalvus vescus TaxID=2953881 RepID=UPI0020914015|nr:hypothetical protein [Natronosalvus vescus]